MKKLSPVLFPTLKNIERVKDKLGYFYKLGLQTD